MNIADQTEKPRRFGPGEEPDEMLSDELPTEEEQENYDILVIRASKMMYGKGREKILKMLGSSETPAQGMGQAAAMLIKSLQDSAKQSGREINGEIALAAGTEIVQELSDLAKSNGVFTFDSEQDEESELADAVLWGVKYYGDGQLQAGEITPEMQELAKAEVQKGVDEEQASKQKKLGPAVKEAIANPQGAGGGGIIGNAARGNI